MNYLQQIDSDIIKSIMKPERPESHDCTLSEMDSCAGCEAIAEVVEQRNG